MGSKDRMDVIYKYRPLPAAPEMWKEGLLGLQRHGGDVEDRRGPDDQPGE